MADGSAPINEIGEVIKILTQIKGAKGKEKQRIMTQHRENELLKSVFKAAVDPSITYGVSRSPVPPAGTLTPTHEWNSVQPLLDKLAARELTGNAAREAITELVHGLSPRQADLLDLILQKDLNLGVGYTATTKVWPGLVFEFQAMLSHKFEPKRIKRWPQRCQTKFDGVRNLCRVRLNDAANFGSTVQQDDAAAMTEMLSREGNPLPAIDHIGADILLWLHACAKAGLITPEDYIIDGEATAGNFNKTVGDVRRKSKLAEDAVFEVFDLVPLIEFEAGKSSLSYEERYQLLERMKAHIPSERISVPPALWVNSVDEIMQIAGQIIDSGGEGVIVKDPGAFYETKRSYAWLKVKCEESEDLAIVGAYEGEPGTKYVGMMGGAIVRFNGVEVHVGGGWTDKERAELWNAYKRDCEKVAEWSISGDDGTDLEFINRVIEVAYHEVTPDGSLRHPRKKRFRDTFTGSKE